VMVTAAGAGERFRREGFLVPKPAIRARGVSLLERSLRSLPLQADDQCCVVVQAEHGVKALLREELRERWPSVHWRWIELDQLEPGQLATAYAALRTLHPSDLEQPLMIHNCDTGFTWPEVCTQNEQRALICAEGWDAAMPVVEAEGEHWSFGQPDVNNPLQAVQIAEKKRISSLASVGLYGFSNAAQLLNGAGDYLDQHHGHQGEAYIAPYLQTWLERGGRISLPRLQRLEAFGTPQELAASTGLSLEQLHHENNSAAR
jgi:CTP:molybdopterin cytidylyltransferase MocA